MVVPDCLCGAGRWAGSAWHIYQGVRAGLWANEGSSVITAAAFQVICFVIGILADETLSDEAVSYTHLAMHTMAYCQLAALL